MNTGTRARHTGVVAKAAYRAGDRLIDDGTGKVWDFSAKGRDTKGDGTGVVATTLLAPPNAPAWVRHMAAEAAKGGEHERAVREDLWNRVELCESRIDAQLAREAQIMLPRELSNDQNLALLLDYIDRAFVQRGMIADVAFHMEMASDGLPQPHAHVLLTMRALAEAEHGYFGLKRRDWNDRALVYEWRELWAEIGNDHLQKAGFPRRLDHRSLKDRGIALEPDVPIGPTKVLRGGATQPVETKALERIRAVRTEAKMANLQRFVADPDFVLTQLTRTQATFTRRDVAAFLFRYAAITNQDDPALFNGLLARVMASRAVTPLGADADGHMRFSTQAMISCEAAMQASARHLARQQIGRVPVRANGRLSVEQQAAAHHVLSAGNFSAIVGYAGTGKTTLLADVRAQLAAQNYRVRGATLAAVAAKNLSDQAGIESQTVARLLRNWNNRDEQGQRDPIDPLRAGDALIIDEAGMIGARDMAALLAAAEAVNAKVILVGDAQQLQSIDSGAAFRTLVENEGAARLETIRRQESAWMREATKDLAQGRVEAAVAAYDAAGHVRGAENRDQAIDGLIDQWSQERRRDRSQLILAHSRADVATLNHAARERLHEANALGRDVEIGITRYARHDPDSQEIVSDVATFAAGDRILFGKNDQRLGVQNGTLGTARHVSENRMTVALDDGRELSFDPHQYGFIDHGYAMTTHKAQGATVDRTYVLATSERWDAHMAYVALSRHRETTTLHYDREAFGDQAGLAQALARARPNESTLDYDSARTALLEAADHYARQAGERPIARPIAARNFDDITPREKDLEDQARALLAARAARLDRERQPPTREALQELERE